MERAGLAFRGEGKLEAALTATAIAAGTAAGLLSLYLPLHFNLFLTLAAGKFAGDYAAAFAFPLAFASLSASVLSGVKKRTRAAKSAAAELMSGYAFAALFLPLAFLALPALFCATKSALGAALLALCLLLVASSKEKAATLAAFTASGLLGFAVLFAGFCNEPLTALFAGFFGLGGRQEERPAPDAGAAALLLAPILGLLLVMLPAATPFLVQPLASAVVPGLGGSNALVISKALYDLVSAQAIGKARSQGAVELAKAGTGTDGIFLGVAAGFFATACACAAHRHAPEMACGARRALEKCAKVTVVALVCALCGWKGLLVCVGARAIALFAEENDVHRGTCLGCLYLPALAYSSGAVAILAKAMLG